MLKTFITFVLFLFMLSYGPVVIVSVRVGGWNDLVAGKAKVAVYSVNLQRRLQTITTDFEIPSSRQAKT